MQHKAPINSKWYLSGINKGLILRSYWTTTMKRLMTLENWPVRCQRSDQRRPSKDLHFVHAFSIWYLFIFWYFGSNTPFHRWSEVKRSHQFQLQKSLLCYPTLVFESVAMLPERHKSEMPLGITRECPEIEDQPVTNRIGHGLGHTEGYKSCRRIPIASFLMAFLWSSSSG